MAFDRRVTSDSSWIKQYNILDVPSVAVNSYHLSLEILLPRVLDLIGFMQYLLSRGPLFVSNE